MPIILTQRVEVTPMSRLEYNNLRQWTLPSDENGSDAGYMIADIDGQSNCKDLGLEGYISWMTAEEFDRRSTSDETEKLIQEKGLTAPRLTPDHIENTIAKEDYFKLTDVLTVCVITLQNGFTVTGESACASPENFDAEVGNKIARENAKEKIWQLEGYLLKQRLFEGK